ncbi:MAG: hypothetical protein AVDCRST_MAG30-2128, partial [uncultured Solirubrobacteraceae bacterium]
MRADFSLDRFERVDASATTALLRLSGVWSEAPGDRAELLVGDATFAPLPDPRSGAGGGPWRAAYPVPVALL